MFTNRIGGALCAALLATCAVPATAGVTIAGSVTGLSLDSSDPGLVLFGSAIDFGPFTLDNVGDTFTTNVLTIGTRESSVEFDDLLNSPVSATFTFSAPAGAGGTATGTSTGFFRVLSSCGFAAGGCGQVQWSNPTVFNFAGGGSFSVSLANVEFATPGSATVAGRFQLLAAPVPEPETWALLILGFGGVGAAMRARPRVVRRSALA